MNERARPAGVLRIGGRIAAALTLILLGCGSDAPQPPPRVDVMPMLDGPTPFIRPGLRQPATEPGDLAELESSEEIIGVSVGDVHRAYVCTAMGPFDNKVINDLIGDVPVTVTFCNRTFCARAFTAKGRSEPLTVQLGGWSGKAMYLSIDGRMFTQDSDEIPLDDISLEKSTWGEWKAAHPEGDVFTGRVPSKPPETRAKRLPVQK
jgi:hypothetical protein